DALGCGARRGAALSWRFWADRNAGCELSESRCGPAAGVRSAQRERGELRVPELVGGGGGGGGQSRGPDAPWDWPSEPRPRAGRRFGTRRA
ncbi:unnamed protein product, partial [Gulo gulo]